MAKFVGIIIGSALIVVGALVPGAQALILVGIGMVLTGIGTLLAKGPLQGFGSATRNPIAPWNVVYGRAKVGGTIIYIGEFDDNNKYLDLVIVLACHACQSVDALLFDGQRIAIDGNGSSFTRPEQTVNISTIVRVNNVVSVHVASGITNLESGDTLIIKDVTGDLTLNGKYAVDVTDSTHFTYICGGSATSQTSGQVQTAWPDYRAKIHMEVLLGDHSATFPGMITGTPYDGDPGDLVLNDNNPWTAAHKVLGKCCVFLRLHYNDEVFSNGLPQISFHVSGKKDISDPRTSPATTGYTENAALCIADYLHDSTIGFKAAYGTEIPLPELIAAANICDESVSLAKGGTEPRYACNGGFPLTVKRGEVLQNLLTSCAGRITYSGGQFVIHPAAWPGSSITLGLPITIRGFSLQTTGNVSSYAMAFPSAAVGDLAVLIVSHAYFAATPSGWTLRNTAGGVSVAGTTYTKTLNASDIAAGSVTLIFGGTYYGSVAMYTVAAAVFVECQGNASPPFGAFSVSGTPTTSAPAAGDIAIYFNSNRSTPASVDSIDHGALDARTSTTEASAVIQSETLATAGSIAPVFAWTVPGDAYYVVTFICSPAVVTVAGADTLALAAAGGPFRWRSKVSIRDLYNGVKGTYISPVNNWQSSDIPPYAQDTLHGYLSGSPLYPEGDANLAADGGDRRWFDIQLPFTISVSAAQRLCKIELMRRRQQGTGTFLFNMSLYQATALDIIDMTLPLLGWSHKLLEISAHRFKLDKQSSDGAEVTVLGTEIDAQETDPSVYDWSSTEELTPQGYQQAPLPSGQNSLDDLYTVNGT